MLYREEGETEVRIEEGRELGKGGLRWRTIRK